MIKGLGALQGWIAEARTSFEAAAHELDALDTALGDGDHGTNMARGFRAATAIGSPSDAALLLRQVGMQLLGTIGGASGALYGTFFLSLAAHWPSEPNTARMAKVLRSARDAVQSRGRAEVGDKTMVDPLDAAVKSMDREDAETPLGEALARAAAAAADNRDQTAALQSRQGRAAMLGERSRGHVDPGAQSMTMLLETLSRHLR